MAEAEGAACGVMDRGGVLGEDEVGGGLRGPGGENVYAVFGERGEDGGGLFGGFAGGVDDFGETGAEAAVVVYAGVAEVFERERGEARRGSRRGEIAAFNGGQEIE